MKALAKKDTAGAVLVLPPARASSYNRRNAGWELRAGKVGGAGGQGGGRMQGEEVGGNTMYGSRGNSTVTRHHGAGQWMRERAGEVGQGRKSTVINVKSRAMVDSSVSVEDWVGRPEGRGPELRGVKSVPGG